MEDISQSFKVQWLNTTLKFIKDDTQLVMKYTQMPSSHLEYLHNLIWQRKNNVGLGFKSLYSPVWEAMKIFSAKYQFKITVEKSEDSKTGHLIMEKIPKKMDDNNNVQPTVNEPTSGNEISNPDIEPRAVTVKKEPLTCKKEKTKKPLPKISKGLKDFMENQKILDTVSPSFIRTALKSILVFMSEEQSASRTFADLAPIESRFLENIQCLCQRRCDFESQLSPVCNNLLAVIAECFERLDTFQLDISCTVNSRTDKREVTFTKVPTFSKKKIIGKILKQKSAQNQNTKLSPTEIPKNINKENLSHINNNDFHIRKKKDLEVTEKTERETKNTENKGGKENIQEVVSAIDNKIIQALSKVVKKDVIPKTKDFLKETINTDTINKSKVSPKELTINTDTDKRINNCAPKSKIFKDMTIPVTSDKAVRMMKLMGWEGGALGLNGCGITEPIIPTANYKCRGLGHVPNKPQTGKGTKKSLRPDKTSTSFINGNIDKLDKKLFELTINSNNGGKKPAKNGNEVKHKNRRRKKEKPNFIICIDLSDNNKKITITKRGKDKRTRHEDVPGELKRSTERSENCHYILTVPEEKRKFETIILTSIHEFIESEQNQRTLHFDKQLTKKFIKCVHGIVKIINETEKWKSDEMFMNNILWLLSFYRI